MLITMHYTQKNKCQGDKVRDNYSSHWRRGGFPYIHDYYYYFNKYYIIVLNNTWCTTKGKKKYLVHFFSLYMQTPIFISSSSQIHNNISNSLPYLLCHIQNYIIQQVICNIIWTTLTTGLSFHWCRGNPTAIVTTMIEVVVAICSASSRSF
jgi:hypothetical protein